jgi:hypothetical protein
VVSTTSTPELILEVTPFVIDPSISSLTRPKSITSLTGIKTITSL